MGERAWWRVAPLVAALAWGGNHFAPLLLLYRQHEGYSQVEVDLLFAIYIAGIVPGFLVSGPLSDRFGRKPLLAVGAALGCAGSAVLAAGADSVTQLAVGRFVSGLSVAVAMVVGSSWIKELCPPGLPAAVAARRASLTLTAGFGFGPAVSGSIAQWGPAPTVLPYLVQIGLTLAACVPFALAQETRTGRSRSVERERVPAEVRRRFVGVVLPAAPWVFGCAGVAFAVVPALVAGATAGAGIAYATLLAVLGLAVGAAVQPLAARIGEGTAGRQLPVGLAVAVAGLLVAAATGATDSPALGLVAAALLGGAYGLCLVSGLTEVQRAAPPQHLARLTAVYYALTYVGFTFPVLLAALAPVAAAPVLLLGLAGLCVGCLVLVLRGLRGRVSAATAIRPSPGSPRKNAS